MTYITDTKLYQRWTAISQHLTKGNHNVIELHGQLGYNKQFLIAKHKTKMRLISQLDWVHYTPLELAHAINTNTIDEYYELKLQDSRSTPNVWKRPAAELELKAYYAARAGRANLI